MGREPTSDRHLLEGESPVRADELRARCLDVGEAGAVSTEWHTGEWVLSL